MRIHDDGACDELGNGQAKQKSTVVLDDDSEHREVTGNRATDHAEREQSTEPRITGAEKKHCSDQLDYTGAIPTPWFEPNLCENIHGLLRPSELKEQRLEQDHRCANAAYPADDPFGF